MLNEILKLQEENAILTNEIRQCHDLITEQRKEIEALKEMLNKQGK